MKRLILEMGTGNDLYGGDYTKAACRAVQDALHHSSITLFQSLGYDHRDMLVKVTIGVQAPEMVDRERVLAELPRGTPELNIVKGGLNAHDEEHEHVHAPEDGVDAVGRGRCRPRLGQADTPQQATRALLLLRGLDA